jgi:hypothetical protein
MHHCAWLTQVSFTLVSILLFFLTLKSQILKDYIEGLEKKRANNNFMIKTVTLSTFLLSRRKE